MIDLSPLEDVLPESFDFYHLGRVQSQPTEVFDDIDTTTIGFGMHGELKAFLIVQFSKELDFSTYSELGNIVASKIAQRLQTQYNLEVMITPPRKLSRSQLEQVLQNNKGQMIRKTYVHLYLNSVIPIETLILQASWEETGHV